MKKPTLQQLETALNCQDVFLYRERSSYARNEAQNNLSGRTHYVDDATLRAFKSRIIRAGIVDQGLLFYVVEHVGDKPSELGNDKKRFVVFDVWGTVINDRASLSDTDAWFSTEKQACKALWAFLNAFDAYTYTKAELLRRADRMERNAKNTRRVFSGRKLS